MTRSTGPAVSPGARRRFLCMLCIFCTAVAAPAAAGTSANAPDLPPPALVAVALDAHPAVAGARAGILVEEANRRRLFAGPHESGVRLGRQTRHDSLAGRSLGEWDVVVERTLRLPAKSRLDERLGTLGVDAARLAVGDARHEAARGLLRQWFAWLRAVAQRSHWEEQSSLFARQAALVTRRAALGDAARQEQWLAEAALAQAEASQVQALTRVEVAAAELLRSYPQLRLPAQVTPVEPAPVDGAPESWLARITEHNHELALARAEIELRRAAAGRAREERTPDPTLGLRVASERAGAERVVGLILAIPITGAQRAAAADAALAQVDVAAQRASAIERRLAAEGMAAYAAATRAREAWQRARAAAEAMSRSAELAARAYHLGESSLSEVLLARRLEGETHLAAAMVRLEAAEARYRLLLDAHQLWESDAP